MFTIEKIYSKKFNNFLDELETDYNNYKASLSILDKRSSDLLHYLENHEELSREELAIIAEKIALDRRARREIKNSMKDIENVLNKFKNRKRMNESASCDYAERTDVLQELFKD